MRTWFMGKAAREKVLLVVFALGLALWWVSGVWERTQARLQEIRITSATLATQGQWLARKDQIQSAAHAALENLDSSRTYNAVRLSGELSTLAQQAGIANNLSSETRPTQQTAQFAVHSVSLQLRRVPFENLLKFYDLLSQRAPYISIARFKLGSADNAGAQLTASLDISSVEIIAP